nr:retrovirus-related Pol polyprotein from transposon TNT 1-94 [Tanacetum cinerariifolium]
MFIQTYGVHLRFKHEAFEKFKEWKQLVENQTGRTVKKLRTDNGLEFCNREFKKLCIESGIARHLTVAGTPQQNRVVVVVVVAAVVITTTTPVRSLTVVILTVTPRENVPLPEKQLHSLERLAEAHARMHLRQEVVHEDVLAALHALSVSLISSQKLGARESVRLSLKSLNDYLLFANALQ